MSGKEVEMRRAALSARAEWSQRDHSHNRGARLCLLLPQTQCLSYLRRQFNVALLCQPSPGVLQ